MSQPDLADLDAFAAVARARGFRAAAVSRGVSPSSLSEAVRRLEERLGVRLLNRTTRSVTPTEAGATLLERLSPALAEVTSALDAVNGFRDSPVGTLRLNVSVAVARMVLPPIVIGFLRAHPGITLEVISDNRFVDVLGSGFDAGIRYEERLERDMIAVPIGPRRQRYVTAAAPAYLAAHGVPEHPRDLTGHACVRHRFESGAMLPWEFEKDGEELVVTPAGPLISSTGDLLTEAAEAGLGLIHVFGEMVEPAIARGTLVPVLTDWSPEFSGPFLYYSSRRLVPAPLRAFLDHVRGTKWSCRD